MTADVVRLPRRVRALSKTYDPAAPFAVERVEHENGYLAFEVVDTRPDSYRIVCMIHELDYDRDIGGAGIGGAWRDAELVARGLNMLVALGKEKP